MGKKSQKKQKVAAQLASRKDAVDIFLNGWLALSTWKDEAGAQQAKVFGLLPADYNLMAWSLTRLAGVLVEMDNKRVKPAGGVAKVLQLPVKKKVMVP